MSHTSWGASDAGNTQSAPQSFVERLQATGLNVAEIVKGLMSDSSVRKIRVKTRGGKSLFSVSLPVGAAVGGVSLLAMPKLTALAAVGSLVAGLTVEVTKDVAPADTDVWADSHVVDED